MKGTVVFQPGDVIDGRFRLVSQIGHGGMGRVFKAVDLETQAIVALKTLRPLYAMRPNHRARFAREARVLSRLQHPNTVQILHTRPRALMPYYVMEHLKGEPLSARLAREGAMCLDKVLEIASEILQSLIEAHSQGVIHRDLKPDNIFLVDKGAGRVQVKVIDFGIAKQTKPREQQSVLTTDGVFMGSLVFIAPEALHGEAVTAASDLYALGHLMYTMLRGESVYEGMSHDKIVVHKLYGKGRPPGEPIEGPVGALLLRAQRLDPKRRFGNAIQMLDHVRFIQKNFAEIYEAKPAQQAAPPGMIRVVDPTQINRWRGSQHSSPDQTQRRERPRRVKTQV